VSREDVHNLALLAADHLPDEVMLIGKDYRIIWANRKARETYLRPDTPEVVGQTCYWVTHRESAPCREPLHQCPLHEVIESGQPCSVNHEHYGSDGEKVHMEITVHPLPDGESFLHLARDVTEQVRQSALQEEMWIAIIGQMEHIFADLANSQANLDAYARRLQESETRYRALYDNASVALYRTRASDGTILMANDNYARMLGYDSAEELIGKSIIEHFVDPTRRQEWICALRERREVRQFELEMLRRDGSRITVCRSGRIYPENDCIEGAVIDITQRQQMEKALVQSEKLRALGEMASGVAHDFNNILSAIIANAQLLEAASPNPDWRHRLHLIQVAAKDGAETIKRIQEFSRVRKDKNFSAIDLNQLIEQVVLITSPRWKDQSQRLGKTISLNTQLQDLPTLAGNPSEIKEVITNIIFNAVDALPQGGEINIRTWQEEQTACLTISDTGAGMPTQVRRRVFDPFFTTKGVTNSGLGLSVSYGIIRRHDGQIEVESQEGAGTTFTIRLPLTEVPQPEAKEEPPQLNGQKARILLVDDEEMVLETLSEVLSGEGHQVVTASGGRQALERFSGGSFDLVLTDLGMPEMSGWELAATIKQQDPAMPVAMITGWGAEFSPEQLHERGVDLVLAKPFECSQVAGLVSRALDVRQKLLTTGAPTRPGEPAATHPLQ
jgi:PAS domain S-box-containing protein